MAKVAPAAFLVIMLLVVLVSLFESLSGNQAGLETLRVLFSWPSVIAALGLCVFGLFRSQLAGVIDRLKTAKIGREGVELQAQPRQDPSSGEGGARTLPLEVQRMVDERMAAIVGKATEASVQNVQLRQALEETIKLAQYWHFQFLGIFLVPTTKRVLKWFAVFPQGPTASFYYEAWSPLIPSKEQQNTIFSVLAGHRLLETDASGFVRVTPLGQQLLSYLEASNDPALKAATQ